MEIRFHYNSSRKQLAFSVFFMLFGLAFLVPSIIVFMKALDSSGADKTVFTALGIAGLLPGLGFLLFGWMRYSRNAAFYREQPWTGIRSTIEGTLICHYFNHWQIKKVEVNMLHVVKISQQSNKGQRFLLFEMKTSPRFVAMPLQYTDPNEVIGFEIPVFSDNRSPIQMDSPVTTATPVLPAFLTEERLRIAETFIRCTEEKLAVTIQRTVFVVNPEEITIGSATSDSVTPRVRVRWIGEGMGDSYSGNYVYQLVYQLENGPRIADGRAYLLKYYYEATDQAGNTSHFVSHMEEQEAEAFEVAFYALLREQVELPETFINQG